MPTLNEKLELGAALFTQPRDLGERRVYGTATAASSDGSVSVDVGGETVTIPTVGAVAQGDEVVIQVQNGHPVAIGVRGWGDEIQADVDEVTSHVWIDGNGNLRVTREPEDQNPTDGVTITNQAVDVASTDYTSELSDNGLTILKNDSIGQVMRMTSTFDGANSLPSVMARRGLILIATDRTSLDNIGAAYDAIVIQPSPPSTGAYKDVVASIESLGLPVFQAKTDRIQFGGVQYDDVYPVASASNLGPVKIGDGLSVASDGTLSERDTGWVNVATGIRARVVGKMMTVVAIGYTTNTTSGWVTVGTLPASITGGAARFLACKYSDGTTRRGEISGNTLKLHQPGTAIGLEFTVTVPVG